MTAARLRDALVVTGRDLDVLAYAVHAARLARRREGRPASPDLDRLAGVLSPNGQPDTPAEPIGQAATVEVLDANEAARLLGVHPRTARRLAPQLDGRKVGACWAIPVHAIQEHLDGRNP